MKFWVGVIAFLALVIFAAPDEEETLSSRITRNLTAYKSENVYASSSDSFAYKSVAKKTDESYYLVILMTFHSSIPEDCTQSRANILDFYKKAIDSGATVSKNDFIENVEKAKQYCIALKD
jgi:hypothetical protein